MENNVDKLYIQVDVEGYITAVAQEAFDGHQETELTMQQFMQEYGGENVTDGRHRYLNGKIICDEGTEKSRAAYVAERKKELREERERVCFSVVNRGQVWYNSLTDEQGYELAEWYVAWLNVTDTLEPPETPEWLR